MLLLILELITYLKLNKLSQKGYHFCQVKRKYMKNIDYGYTNTLECIPENIKMYFAYILTSHGCQEV